jgi:tRNA G18 (ribose-2'-O)-methylase SpoU
MTVQRSHHTTNFILQKYSIVLLCDGVQSPANIGSIFRISEAFGVEKIIFCNAVIDFSSARLRKTARNTIESAEYEVSNDILAELEQLKLQNYELIGLEITDSSIALDLFQPTNKKIALVVGNERHGISQEVLALVSDTVHIQLYGTNSSMNVSQATGIALFSLINKLK